MVFKKKPQGTDLENFLSSILDPQDFEVFIVRGKECEILFANAKAETRIYPAPDAGRGCRMSFAKSFPDLCGYCPCRAQKGETTFESFEIEDKENRTYAVTCNIVDWVDGKPASLFFLRDVSQEKLAQQRLYNLAYIDQLTGIPNRQKLKDDFKVLEGEIANSQLTGIIAMFDLDNFKVVNDTYGHNTGDIVLRRLAEYLQGEKMFSGHLYRLSGDEFVLFYSEPFQKFGSDEEMKDHYNSVLSTALRAYTLPNIEVKCTLSIGVSFFPRHGSDLSDLLRKADIALYKAKGGGRNQLVFFEDQYDTAQKFKDLYIIIQPILLGSGKTFGYELVDRGNIGEEDENTVNLHEFNRTLDVLGIGDMENSTQYFVSFTKQLLNPAVVKNLPRGKFIVQMRLPAKLTQQDLQTYHELRGNGYKLAFIGLDSARATPEILTFADYCKFDPEDTNLARQKAVITANPKVKFIATKVDSTDAFLTAKDAGFYLYQGYFFNQPVRVKKTKAIDPLKTNYFRLLKLSSSDDYMDFREISAVISSDVALSYKLLRVLNSAAVGLREVSSVEMAVAYMGEENLKKWIALFALRGVVEDKPLELIRVSLVRAQFGELLAPHFQVKHNPKQVFMVGMLSLLHIALEESMEQLLEKIPVAQNIRESLLTENGIYSDLLRFYEYYEYANWEKVAHFVEGNQLDPQFVSNSYIAAVKWCNDLVGYI